ncbi:MAG: phospholipid carrier-dependent glycosyltransferase [Candidatus Shapirobacteria bacterium]
MKNKILLILIIILAFVVRVLQINSFPPSLNWDEASLGYNAYSILKTGRDEWGSRWPLIFRAYGDYKLPVYIYLSIPFIAIFGLNALSIKLISIISGTVLVYIVYLTVEKLSKSQKIALVSALLIAFSPWSIFLSRIALEANLFLLLFALSFYFLISKKIYLSSLFFALSLFTYNSSRVLLPFYLIALIYVVFKEKIKINFVKLLPLIFSLIIFIFQFFNSSGTARYQWVSILDQGAINRINELQPKYSRLVVNKATYFLCTSFKNYISHFNPLYLFKNGGSHYQFNIPNFYLLSPLLLVFFLFGLYYLSTHLFNYSSLLLIFFLIISPIPSAITRDAPHVLRSLTFVYLSTLVISLGFSYMKKFALPVAIMICLIMQIQFWPKYKQYSVQYSQSWQYGYRQVIDYVKNNYNQYDQFIISKKYGEAHEFILFFWPWDPDSYHTDSKKVWDYHSAWYWVDAFDKFKFIDDEKIMEKSIYPNTSTLLITTPRNYNQNSFKKLETINFLDGTPAFEILKNE